MPEQRDLSRERLVRAAVAENPITAEMIRDQLAQGGIRCMLKNRDALAAYTGGGFANPWTVEVWVLEGDSHAAARILGDRPAGPPLPAPSIDGPPRRRGWWSRLLGKQH